MAYLIGDIVEAISTVGVSLRTLQGVDFELDRERKPIFSVGGNVVVFRVVYEGQRCAMRCYMRSKPYLREIYGERYYPKELCVESRASASLNRSVEVDVVLCDWVEGETLNRVVRRGIEGCDQELLGRLVRSFDCLADSMLSRRDWAHGDLSGSNILVDKEFGMHLIDHDANYVESLAGCESVELGTPAYQSPLRTSKLFCAEMDDVSIALIAVSLRALRIDPMLGVRYPSEDGLLLDGSKILSGSYQLLSEVVALLARMGDFAGYRIARMLSRYETHYEMLPSLISFSLREKGSSMSVEALSDIETFESMGVWGYCDMRSGEIMIPPMFDEAFDFRGDEALVRLWRWWFYIDRHGRVVQSCGEWLEGKPPVSRCY